MEQSDTIKELRLQIYALKEDARIMADTLHELRILNRLIYQSKVYEATERWRTK